MIRSDKIAFILSMPRSGSTMLRVHVDKLEDCIALPELHLFPFKKKFGKLNFSNEGNREQILDEWINFFTFDRIPLDKKEHLDFLRSENLTSWDALFAASINYYQEKLVPNKQEAIFVEKSPPHIFFQKEIDEMFPQAKFIYLVRDPRSVIGSLKNMSWSTSNVLVLARSWQISTDLIRQRKNSIVVRYEDIVEDPQKVFDEVGDFLDSKGKISVSEKIESKIEKNNWNSAEVFRPINKNNLEKWRGQLSKTDCHVQIIEEVCSKGMDRFGYKKLNLPKKRSYYFNTITSYLYLFLTKLFS